ncbi:MAG: SAM-dependent methyltransferase, partial [Acidobacteria bacterium]
MNASGPIPSSFRDPSGFLFWRDGTLYRQVNVAYRDDYCRLIDSSLYDSLVAARLLIPHEEVPVEAARPGEAYKVIRPEPVDFVSYPYEWCFSQLKDAALATLAIQKKAIGFGMSLKDASAYNVQFHAGRPVLVDTLSFETYKEGRPWPAYRQFCQHFLAPLTLMSRTDVRLAQLLRTNIDGVPFVLASRLQPFRTRFMFSTLAHIHLHARSQK